MPRLRGTRLRYLAGGRGRAARARPRPRRRCRELGRIGSAAASGPAAVCARASRPRRLLAASRGAVAERLCRPARAAARARGARPGGGRRPLAGRCDRPAARDPPARGGQCARACRGRRDLLGDAQRPLRPDGHRDPQAGSEDRPAPRRVARSALLKRIVFGRWGASDPPALSPEVVEAFLAGPARHTDTVSAAKALVRDDVRADLERVRCPGFVLWGARDNQLPVADAFEYARRLRAPLRVIGDCGHLLIGERPDACADAIRRVPRGGTGGSPARRSGCPDLNWGPLRPERSALPGCATPRAPTG